MCLVSGGELLSAKEVGSVLAVSHHLCREFGTYVYFHCNPALFIWEELLRYCCIITFIPLFLPFLFCLLFYLIFLSHLRNLAVADRNVQFSSYFFC
jgi:hypothetical protein